MKQKPNPRFGTLVVCVLVCLLIASAIVTATTQLALRSRRDVRIQQQLRQTELLLDAGVLRAAQQIRRSADYQGESWRPGSAITRFEEAVVEIRVKANELEEEGREVEVTASLGVGVHDDGQPRPATRTRRSHSFQIQSPASTPTPDSPTLDSTDSDPPARSNA